ncbi:MAG TPA: 2-isopropylmalate synthase [Methylomirabilota bacterium]|nr:2-isopropylmalate synthase [Methylomirabilota bacterium]
MRQIEIFDTTLRDGEQAPGAALSAPDKLRMARALAELGVDTIEAGFPAASAEELEAVKTIAREVSGSTIAALARATDGDVDAAARALAPAQRKRIHVFISTSEIHLDRMLRMTPGECMDRAVRAVRRASEHADEVEFSAQDATRTDIHFLVTICQEAARAGARYINIPDTVGYAQPAEFAKLVLAVRGALATYNGGLKVSVHCHNDLGLAVANTLAAVEAGAQQVEVCVNGMGERGGNASLEEVAMSLRVRRDHYGADTRLRADRIVPTSRLFSELTGIPVQPNKAIVGANAFAHASGIHQDGVLKDPLNYEIMTPDSVGWDSRRIVVTRLSGRHGLAARFQELGIALDRETLDRAYGLAMDHSAVAPELDDRMLIAIAAQARRGEAAPTAAD